jgi:hypothetical protein
MVPRGPEGPFRPLVRWIRAMDSELRVSVIPRNDRAEWHNPTASYAEALRSLKRTGQRLENSQA